jgi:hypothetical protein
MRCSTRGSGSSRCLTTLDAAPQLTPAFHMILTENDIAQLHQRGINAADLVALIHQFTQDTLPVHLEKPCIKGDGILVLSATDCHRFQRRYEQLMPSKRVVKFVPASGAASRMFKHLFNYSPNLTTDLVEEFILNFDRFPFLYALREAMKNEEVDLDQCVRNNDWSTIFSYILSEDGLGYASAPKGMVLFHLYSDGARTAFEEHLHEAMGYAKEFLGVCRLHFTVPAPQKEAVEHFLRKKAAAFRFEEFDLSFSVQSENTDMIALDRNNEPLRHSDGTLIFRPAGHGALIHNLEASEADLIFIKNIDNVTTDEMRDETIFYKKVIGGLLLDVQQAIHALLDELEQNTPGILQRAVEFVREWFQPSLPLGLSEEQLRHYMVQRLNRPLRVCGMVRNEGEPGGGPFWVRMEDGSLSKQIVERSQIDPHNVEQSLVFENSTHFNPVDIVCALRDRHGRPYVLNNYIDHSTGFVTEKFVEGKVIKALELPGLWNGAMALWNTIFVEVPVSTFTPVKTVNDLLRPGHQVTH